MLFKFVLNCFLTKKREHGVKIWIQGGEINIPMKLSSCKDTYGKFKITSLECGTSEIGMLKFKIELEEKTKFIVKTLYDTSDIAYDFILKLRKYVNYKDHCYLMNVIHLTFFRGHSIDRFTAFDLGFTVRMYLHEYTDEIRERIDITLSGYDESYSSMNYKYKFLL